MLQCRLEYVGENSVGQNILSERNILSDRMCREEEQKRIRSAEQCVARSYKQYIYYIDKLSISKYRVNDQELDSSEKGGKWDIYFHILSIILYKTLGRPRINHMKTSTTVSSALTFEIYLLGADTEQTEQMRDALHPQWD